MILAGLFVCRIGYNTRSGGSNYSSRRVPIDNHRCGYRIPPSPSTVPRACACAGAQVAAAGVSPGKGEIP